MYACTDPISNSPDTNCRQEEVPHGGDEFELDHLNGSLLSLSLFIYIGTWEWIG